MRLRAVGILAVLAMVAVLGVAPPAGAHGGRPLSASLTGASEIPGPGDPTVLEPHRFGSIRVMDESASRSGCPTSPFRRPLRTSTRGQ